MIHKRALSPAERTASANRLLAGLPRKDRDQFIASCERVNIVFADVLYQSGERIEHVYFPTDSFISVVTPLDGHAALEVGMIGNEGMLGVSLSLGVGESPLHAMVQGSGPALRMSAPRFRQELEASPALQRALNRYLYVLMRQLAQTAACARFHVLEARLARWLLMTQDRAHSDAFHVTHESLGHILGVRRVGVTKAATALQNKGLISYHRGDITVLYRRGLEDASCECYAADMQAYDRVFG
jgi:CRP-like cAMP-binding protein